MKDSYNGEMVGDTIFRNLRRNPRAVAIRGVAVRIRPYLPFWAVTAVWAVAYWPALKTLLAEWIVIGAGNYGHGFLVLGISAYFIWGRRRVLQLTGEGVNAVGVCAVAVLGFGWLVGFSTNTLILQQLAAVVLFHALLLSVFGYSAYKTLFFPLLLIFSAVPIWGELQNPLRDLSTQVSFSVLQAMDVPILRQGYRLTVPGGVFVVERACSGLNFLLVSLVLSWMFCHIHRLRGFNRGLMILLSVLVAIMANWVRIVLIILVGDATRMQHFLVKDHLYAGWLVYAITLLPLFWLGYRLSLRRGRGPLEWQSAAKADAAAGPARARLVYPAAVGALAAVFPALPLLQNYWGDAGKETQGLGLGAVSGAELVKRGFNAPRHWTPHYTGADSELSAIYRFEGYNTYVYIANYQRQAQGKELIHYSNKLYDHNRWWHIEDKRITPDHGGDMRMLHLGSNGGKRVIGYWYQVSGRVAVSGLEAKMLEVLGVFTGRGNAAVVAVALDYENMPDDQAAERVARFSGRLRKTFVTP